MNWLDLFSNYKFLNRSKKASHLLLEILKNKWKLKKDDIDIVVMYHSFTYKENNHFKKKESFMKIEGKNNLETAMSKTVGLPIALLIELIIKKNHEFKGVILPFDEIILRSTVLLGSGEPPFPAHTPLIPSDNPARLLPIRVLSPKSTAFPTVAI